MKSRIVTNDGFVEEMYRCHSLTIDLPVWYVQVLIEQLKEELQGLHNIVETEQNYKMAHNYRVRRYHINRMIPYLENMLKSKSIIDPLYIEAVKEVVVDFAISRIQKQETRVEENTQPQPFNNKILCQD